MTLLMIGLVGAIGYGMYQKLGKKRGDDGRFDM